MSNSRNITEKMFFQIFFRYITHGICESYNMLMALLCCLFFFGLKPSHMLKTKFIQTKIQLKISVSVSNQPRKKKMSFNHRYTNVPHKIISKTFGYYKSCLKPYLPHTIKMESIFQTSDKIAKNLLYRLFHFPLNYPYLYFYDSIFMFDSYNKHVNVSIILF